jgi:hypothetical protein
VVVSAVVVMGQEWMGLGADVDYSRGSVDLGFGNGGSW